MGDGLLVLLTVRGIGFQQPPRDGVEGYADQLHKRLKTEPPWCDSSRPSPSRNCSRPFRDWLSTANRSGRPTRTCAP